MSSKSSRLNSSSVLALGALREGSMVPWKMIVHLGVQVSADEEENIQYPDASSKCYKMWKKLNLQSMKRIRAAHLETVN